MRRRLEHLILQNISNGCLWKHQDFIISCDIGLTLALNEFFFKNLIQLISHFFLLSDLLESSYFYLLICFLLFVLFCFKYVFVSFLSTITVKNKDSSMCNLWSWLFPALISQGRLIQLEARATKYSWGRRPGTAPGRETRIPLYCLIYCGIC